MCLVIDFLDDHLAEDILADLLPVNGLQDRFSWEERKRRLYLGDTVECIFEWRDKIGDGDDRQ
jgi:hypothetical protein